MSAKYSGHAALLSVSDRSGIESFAKGLAELGFTLLTTSGTAKALSAAGIQSTPIEQYTGQAEILDGRVKTLHPKIHAGILARRDDRAHISQLENDQILPIDVVAVNLYPFVKKKREGQLGAESALVEFIDVGGPTMIRGAAKNFAGVYPVIDPSDYPAVLEALASAGESEGAFSFRRALAAKVFVTLAQDALEIASSLSSEQNQPYSKYWGQICEKGQDLRYGENPTQSASLYFPLNGESKSWRQLGGKALSYNNLLDLDAALALLNEFNGRGPFVAIIKHLNPCGAAFGATLLEALSKAKRCDPRSHFGGIIVCNQEVDEAVAESVGADFAEIIVAPAFGSAALESLGRKKNLRIIDCHTQPGSSVGVIRSAAGGILTQSNYPVNLLQKDLPSISSRRPTQHEQRDLDFAWSLCAHLKSNAIALVKDGMLIGAGAGQMSRVDSVELAINKAKLHGHDLQGAVAASDAFFPFPDGPETLARAGIRAIVAPSGAKRDDETIAVCNSLDVALIFTESRVFRH